MLHATCIETSAPDDVGRSHFRVRWIDALGRELDRPYFTHLDVFAEELRRRGHHVDVVRFVEPPVPTARTYREVA